MASIVRLFYQRVYCAEMYTFLMRRTFFIILWDLVNFLGEIQTTSKSISYGFYGVNGPFEDFFING